jgi:hypothetical protein
MFWTSNNPAKLTPYIHLYHPLYLYELERLGSWFRVVYRKASIKLERNGNPVSSCFVRLSSRNGRIDFHLALLQPDMPFRK